MNSKLIAIAALGKNRQIGLNNALPWKLPDEYQHFLRTIRGKHVLVGRKNLEIQESDLGAKGIFVLSRGSSFEHPTAILVRDLNELKRELEARNIQELYVMGGAQIYELTLPYISEFHCSLVNYDGPADTYFPPYEELDWQVLQESQHPEWKFKLLKKKPLQLK